MGVRCSKLIIVFYKTQQNHLIGSLLLSLSHPFAYLPCPLVPCVSLLYCLRTTEATDGVTHDLTAFLKPSIKSRASRMDLLKSK